MSFSNWDTCPADVRAQIRAFLAETQQALAHELVGVYLHGSLAMGCFNPARSDLDLLVITRHPMPVLLKRAIAEQLLHRSRRPTPIEISYLTPAMLQPWHYPPLFDFHFSEAWRDLFDRDLASDGWRAWNATQRRDLDLAAHITVLRQRGRTLYGPPIPDVFPPVPHADYVASIMDDVASALDALVDDPVYGILNACRTLAYLRTAQVYSKDEGGAWGIEHLPEELRSCVQQARARYADGTHPAQFSRTALTQFQEWARQELHRLAPA